MTTYKHIKRRLENICGSKFRMLSLNSVKLNDFGATHASRLSSPKYTFTIFGDDRDNVWYYAVETDSRLPVSWHRESKNCARNCKRTGFNYSIEESEIFAKEDYAIMQILDVAGHLGHFDESVL